MDQTLRGLTGRYRVMVAVGVGLVCLDALAEGAALFGGVPQPSPVLQTVTLAVRLAMLPVLVAWVVALARMRRHIIGAQEAAQALQELRMELDSALGRYADDTSCSSCRDRMAGSPEITRARLKHLLDSTPAVVYAFRHPLADSQVTFVSANITRVLGYAPDDFIRDPRFWIERVHPQDRAQVLRGLAALPGEGRRVFEYRFRHADGSYRDILDEKAVIRGASGEVLEVVGAALDVTALRREQAQQARMAAIIDAMPHLVATADAEGNLLTLNQAGREMLGIRADEAVTGLRLADILAPGSREVFEREAAPAAAASGVWTGEVVVRDAAGNERAAVQTLLAHRNSAGEIEFLSTIVRDISHSRQLEEELRRAQRLQALGQLAGGVAHDFNNMLMPILAYANLLVQSLDRDDQRRAYAEEIERAAERAAALPRQLLAFGRRQAMRPVPLDLGAVVAEMERMLKRVLGERIELVVHTEPHLGTVLADPGQVEQVLMNLVVNARDAMPEGGTLTVRAFRMHLDAAQARARAEMHSGPHVVLEVSDTGVGMSEDVRSRLFEPFFTTKPVGQGTGLGLATVYGIVKQSGGDVRVFSELGHGATFQVVLPCAEATTGTSGTAGAGGSLQRGAGTILLVEDDEIVREVVRSVLERAGYRVLEAPNGMEALRLSPEVLAGVDLVVTDVVMPGINGPDMVEQLLAVQPRMKVLFMSGYAEGAVLERAVQRSGGRLIQKPFTGATLTRLVREMLDPPV